MGVAIGGSARVIVKAMTSALIVLGVVSLLELLLYVPLIWKVRKPTSVGVLLLLAMSSGALFAIQSGLATGLLLIIGLYRLVNLLRIIDNRLEPHFLHRTTWRTSAWLIGLQIMVLGAWGLGAGLGLAWGSGLLIVASAQLLVAIMLVATTWQQLRLSQAMPSQTAYTDHDLPTVSVCVPARNETPELQTCLEALVTSDYPKLEILILDDCSQDRTSDIIRSFAQAGVRFIKGSVPPADWLAKNWAYQQLYHQASAELLLFCGVDMRLEPGSIRALVAHLLNQQKLMISVIPTNQLPQTHGWLALLLQPMRYAWELSPPRGLLRRPPVLSTCWLAHRKVVAAAGSFAAVQRSISPESYFARLASQQAAYGFIRSDDGLAVSSRKTATDQWQTALRTRYPQVHRRPELVLLLSSLEVFGMGAAPFIALYSLVAGFWTAAVLAAVASLLYAGLYGRLVGVTYGRYGVVASLGFPIALLLDSLVRHYSMIRYEFSEVIWRGRNICLPIMRVIPRLPKS